MHYNTRSHRRPYLATMTRWALAATGSIALVFSGCSQPKPQPQADGSPPTVVTPAKKKESLSALPQETRDALKKEYQQLALKNDCSRGMLPKLAGSWRFIGDSKTPAFADTLTLDGNGRFSEVMTGEPDGKKTRADIQGEMRCTFSNRVLVQIDKVSPEGAFGNQSGDRYPCDLLGDLANTGNKMLMICYFDWDVRTSAGLEFEYEKIEAATP